MVDKLEDSTGLMICVCWISHQTLIQWRLNVANVDPKFRQRWSSVPILFLVTFLLIMKLHPQSWMLHSITLLDGVEQY